MCHRAAGWGCLVVTLLCIDIAPGAHHISYYINIMNIVQVIAIEIEATTKSLMQREKLWKMEKVCVLFLEL